VVVVSVDKAAGARTVFVLGEYGHETRYRELADTHDLDASTIDRRDEVLAGGRRDLAPVEYLVLEAGEHEEEILAAATAHDVAVLYVSADPERAKAAMTGGADVYIAPENREHLPQRFESLHLGAVLESSPVDGEDGVLGNVHGLAYESLMEKFEDLIYVFDRHGRFLRVNRAKAASLDKAPAELVGDTDFTHFPADVAVDSYRDTLEVAEGLRTVDNKAEWLVDGDGDRHHVTATKHGIETDDGVVIGVVGVSRDITELTRERVRVERTKSLVEHLYDTFDHNFRNRSQAQLGITSLAESRHTARGIDTTLSGLEGTLEEMAAVTPNGGDGAVDDPGDATRSGGLRPGEVEAEVQDLCETARSGLADLTEALAAAENRTTRKVDEMDRLIAEFSELVAVVNTAQRARPISLVERAEEMLDRPVHADAAVTVLADEFTLSTLFEQLDAELRAPGGMRIDETAEGFELTVPGHVELPAMDDRFRVRHLDEESKPKLKVRLAVESLGWSVEVHQRGENASVLSFDVDAWKREQASQED
jgi:PAS domain S-box-containing protein